VVGAPRNTAGQGGAGPGQKVPPAPVLLAVWAVDRGKFCVVRVFVGKNGVNFTLLSYQSWYVRLGNSITGAQ
jgi:hypothetical protein